MAQNKKSLAVPFGSYFPDSRCQANCFSNGILTGFQTVYFNLLHTSIYNGEPNCQTMFNGNMSADHSYNSIAAKDEGKKGGTAEPGRGLPGVTSAPIAAGVAATSLKCLVGGRCFGAFY